ncbi:hypothetical protein BHE74_00035819, partial [Ensete ventricosum]
CPHAIVAHRSLALFLPCGEKDRGDLPHQIISLQLLYLIEHWFWIGFLLMVHLGRQLFMIITTGKISMLLYQRACLENCSGLKKNTESTESFRKSEEQKKRLFIRRLG